MAISPAYARPRTVDSGFTCGACRRTFPMAQAAGSLYVCPACGHHSRISAHERVRQLADKGTFQEWDPDLVGRDRLGFVDTKAYVDRLAEARQRQQLPDAILTGAASICGHPVGLASFDFGFLGGSLSTAVGERLARAIERSAAELRPFVCVTSSGGARMQEGVFSLMQMAKSVAALHELVEAHVPFISILAEPKAMIGFTGARVITQATYEQLPAGFQTSEFHHARGLIDQVVDRRQLREVLGRLLAVLGPSAAEDARRPA